MTTNKGGQRMTREFMKFWVITKNVYKTNVKSWGFLLMVLSPLLFVGVSVLITLYTPDPADSTVAILSDNESVREAFIEHDIPWSIDASITTEEGATNALVSEDIDGIIQIETESDLSATLTQTNGLFDDYTSLINEQLTQSYLSVQSKHTGLSPDVEKNLSQGAQSNTQQVRIENGEVVYENANEYQLQQSLMLFAASGLFFLLTIYPSSIMGEIASEKGTRMMEIILSATKARTHLLGKLCGMLLVILTQFGIYGLPFVFGLRQVPSEAYQELFGTDNVIETLKPVLVQVVGFSFVGLLLYVLLAALLGSLASRPSDASKLGIPLTVCSFIGYIGSISISGGATNPLFSVLSYIPLFSPQLMPLRIFHNQVSQTEAVWAFIICILFSIIVFGITVYTYKSNVLAYSKTSIRQTIQRSWDIHKANQKK